MYTLIYTDSCFKCLVKYIVLTPGKAANLRATVHMCTLQRLILLSYLHMKGIEDKTGCNQIHYTTCYSNMHTHSFNAPLVSWFPRIGTTIDKGTTLDFTNKILHGRVYVVLTTKQININKFFLIPTKPGMPTASDKTSPPVSESKEDYRMDRDRKETKDDGPR